MDKVKIVGEVTLLDGRIGAIILPLGQNYSRAVAKSNRQTEFDISLFLLEELALIDGKKQTIEFYKELYCDDYMKLVEVLGTAITIIR